MTALTDQEIIAEQRGLILKLEADVAKGMALVKAQQAEMSAQKAAHEARSVALHRAITNAAKNAATVKVLGHRLDALRQEYKSRIEFLEAQLDD